MALMLMLGGCGSGGSSTSGVDGSKKIGDLTSAEKASFCDWAANQLGGYKKCDEIWSSGTGHGFMSEPDRNACVDNWDDACAASVNQAEACINSLPNCPSIEQAKESSACSDFIKC
jgi:hypothetical protein